MPFEYVIVIHDDKANYLLKTLGFQTFLYTPRQSLEEFFRLNNQTGCAWNNTILDFNNPFNLSLNYYFGNNINGADGTTFTFQPNPTACGTAGGQLGAGGIPNSLVIEFDTYDNDNPAHIYDISQDHIAVEIDGIYSVQAHLIVGQHQPLLQELT